MDYELTRKQVLKDVLITRAMRGANYCIDHRVVRTKYVKSLRRLGGPSSIINIRSLKCVAKQKELQEKLQDSLNADFGNVPVTSE